MSESRISATPRAALTVVGSLFFMWGFLTSLNDILIPHLKVLFELDYARAMLVQFTFFGAYFLMSLPAGWLVARLGYKSGIVAGLVIAGIGALGFWPAAELRLYAAFLAALFVLATGITVLQVAANPYAARLGPAATSSSRLTLVQALNSLGTAIGPMFGGLLILGGSGARAVQGPYLGLAIALFVLAGAIFVFRLPHLAEERDAQNGQGTLSDALAYRQLRNGVLAIFCYVGAEVAIGSFMVNYLSLPDIGHIDPQQATKYVSAYWTLAMIGRFAGSALMVKFSPRKLLAIFAAVNIALLLASMLGGGAVSIYSMVGIGLFNSIMFPTIFSLGIEGLGASTGKASSLLIMAIVGGALVPLVQGVLADRIGLHMSYVVPLLCYAWVVFYGARGSQPK